MRVFWKTDTSLHGGRRGGVRENSRLASMERASPEIVLADNCLVPACGPCSVDLSDNPNLGASLFQVLGVTGLQRLSSCANWSFDEGCPKSCFLHRGLHGGLFHVLIGKVTPFSSCRNCQHMPDLVSVHLIGGRDRHLSKLQEMTLPPMTRQEVPPLLTLSGAVLEAQWDRVGHITLSDRCRRPVGREKKKKPRCLIFGTRTIDGFASLDLIIASPPVPPPPLVVER